MAISFAGEQRKLAEFFATRLDAAGYSIFYDKFETAQLWGSDVATKLGDVYGKQARYCLILVSNEYIDKMWTNHERSYAVSRALRERSEYILPLKLDDLELPGVPETTGYVRFSDTSEDDILNFIYQKLGLPQHEIGDVRISSEDQAQVLKLLQACYRRALFTKMDSEISMPVMFSSLGECLSQVQKITPTFQAPEIQHLATLIVRDLDQFERYSLSHHEGISNFWPFEVKQEMDNIKLRVIENLFRLRRMAKLQFQLPESLTFDHFFSIEEASAPPSK